MIGQKWNFGPNVFFSTGWLVKYGCVFWYLAQCTPLIICTLKKSLFFKVPEKHGHLLLDTLYVELLVNDWMTNIVSAKIDAVPRVEREPRRGAGRGPGQGLPLLVNRERVHQLQGRAEIVHVLN